MKGLVDVIFLTISVAATGRILAHLLPRTGKAN